MKKILLFPIFFIFMLFSVSASIPVENLVGYWDFREGNQTVFSNLMGTGENLTLLNGAYVNSSGQAHFPNTNSNLLISGSSFSNLFNDETPITFIIVFETFSVSVNNHLFMFSQSSTNTPLSRAVIESGTSRIANSLNGASVLLTGNPSNLKGVVSQIYNISNTLAYIRTENGNISSLGTSGNIGVFTQLVIGNLRALTQNFQQGYIQSIFVFNSSLSISEIDFIYDNQEDDFLLFIGGLNIDNEMVSGNIYSDTYYNGNISFSINYEGNISNLTECSLTTNGNSTFLNASINSTSCFLNISPNEDINYSWVISDGTDTLQTTFLSLYYDNDSPFTEAILNNTVNINGWFNDSVSIILNASDILSGVNNTFYCFENNCNPETEYNDSIIFSNEGQNILRYKSFDNLNNNETIKEQHINIDISPPETQKTIVGTLENDTYTSVVSIILNGFDSNSGINNTFFCLGVNCSPETEYFNEINIVISGEYIIRFLSIDNAGNIENITELNLSLQIQPIQGGSNIIVPVFVGEGIFKTRVGNDTMISLIILIIVSIIAGYMRQRLGVISLLASLFLIPLGIILYLVTSNLIIGLFIMIIGILLIFQE